MLNSFRNGGVIQKIRMLALGIYFWHLGAKTYSGLFSSVSPLFLLLLGLFSGEWWPWDDRRCESKCSIGSVLQPKHNTKRQRMSCGLPVQYWTGVALKGSTTPREQRFLWLAEAKKNNWKKAWTPLEPRAMTCTWIAWIDLKILSL